jgi:IS5 family transposase
LIPRFDGAILSLEWKDAMPQGAPHGIEPAGKKRGLERLIGRTKGRMNTKLHAFTDAYGRPLSFFMTAGQVSDYTGAAPRLDDLPKAQWMLADRGYDADWYRDALQAKGITPCIPGRKSRIKPVKYDSTGIEAAAASRSCLAV